MTFGSDETYFFLARLRVVTGLSEGNWKGDRMSTRLPKVTETPGFGATAPFSWRFVELDFHNDNRLSWWLSHFSSPLR